jgi:hypothetical protein
LAAAISVTSAVSHSRRAPAPSTKQR